MPNLANYVWRDYVTDGVPASGFHDPEKPDIRAWGTWIESFVSAIGENSGSVFLTRSALYADLAHAANSMAWVIQDPTVAYNGIYQKQGSSGTGSWTRVGDLPYSFIVASNVGAGTPSAIEATTSIPVSSSALILVNIAEDYLGSAATISFNGGSPLVIKSNSGEDVQSLAAGSIVYGVIAPGGIFRLASDEAIAALLEQYRDEALEARDEAVAARDIAAGYASDAVSQGNVPIYATVVGMSALTIPSGINALRVNGYNSVGDHGGGYYIEAGSEPAHAGKFQSDDGAWWELSEMRVTPQMFGGVVNSYADRTINTTAINNALEYAGLFGAVVDLGGGDWFVDGLLRTGPLTVSMHGRGINYWHPRAGDGSNPATKVACATQILVCGTITREFNYLACSSMKECGAARVNPSARVGFNEEEYLMLSFTDGPGSLRDFSIALLVEAHGCHFSDFRIVPYGGGTHGLDGYNNPSLVGWNGDVDFGIWNDFRNDLVLERVQAVGHFRGAGHFFGLYRFDEPDGNYQAQNNAAIDCTFQGFRGHATRGSDTFRVVTVNLGSNWIEVPYADDHPFHPDVYDLVMKADSHTASSAMPAITGVSVVTPGLLRLQLDASPTTISVNNDIVVNGHSGATSHNSFTRTAFYGITHPSGNVCHNQALTDAFPTPSAMCELSGWRAVEYGFYNPRFHGIEQIGLFIHSLQKITMIDVQAEASQAEDSGGQNMLRMIISPSRGQNTHADYPSGGPYIMSFSSPFSPLEDRIDWRPYAPVTGLAFNGSGDNGFMEGNILIWPEYAGGSNMVGGGGFLRPNPGGKAGIKKAGSNITGAANAMAYNDATSKMELEVYMDTSSFEANFGLVTGSATGIIYKSGRQVDFTLADDAVANIAFSANAAILVVGTNTPGVGGNGGLASIRTGTTSQNCAILVGSNLSAEGSTVLTDGTGNGTDTKYNVSCQNGNLQIKNRSGASQVFHLELLATS